jgi:N-methylhydantoinase B/oxoprolinase/acetone carboxylase alpha subunit
VNGEEQPAKVTRTLAAGDVVRIETPGGGGFGRPV